MIPDYYHYYKVCIPETRSKRIAKKVKFYLYKIFILNITKEEAILITTINISEALKSY